MSASPSSSPAPSRPNPVPLIILGVLALFAIGFGVSRWRWGLTHIRTDNAQVEGHIVPTLARVGGFVLEVAVRENQTVEAGQSLVRLDDREAVTRLAQAEADLQQALMAQGVRGRVGQAEAQLAAARANVTQAEANAQRARQDAERAQRLAVRGIVSSAQLDAAVTGAEAAEKLLRACGAAGIFDDFEIQRCYLDAWTAASHIGTTWDAAASQYAQVVMGVTVEREGSDKPVCVAESVVRHYA